MIWIQRHDAQPAAPQKHEEGSHPDKDGMLSPAAVAHNIESRHDLGENDEKSPDEQKTACHEEIPRRDREPLVETSRISGRNEGAHPEVSDHLCEIDNEKPVKRVKAQLVLCDRNSLQAN